MENFTEFLDKRKKIAKTGEMISKISEGKFSICLGYLFYGMLQILLYHR